MDKKRLRVRTLILSDVHLGTPDCKARELNHFLRTVRCEKLILNGDIIDGWHLRRAGHWTKAHTRFVRIVEHADGRFELVDYRSFVRAYPMPSEEPAEGPQPGDQAAG
jgi:hypothetical protein